MLDESVAISSEFGMRPLMERVLPRFFLTRHVHVAETDEQAPLDAAFVAVCDTVLMGWKGERRPNSTPSMGGIF